MDMKRYIFLLALLACSLLACTKGDKVVVEEEKSGFSLTVVCKEPSTKAQKAGENEYNENLLKTLDCFFYPEGGTSSNAVVHKRWTAHENETVLSQHTMDINIDEITLKNVLFPRGSTRCKVAVIANHPYPNNASDPTDLETLLGLTLSTDFSSTADFGDPPIQPSFVMFGSATVNLNASTSDIYVASTTVELQRVASKITLSAHIEDQVEITNRITIDNVEHVHKEIWKPNLSGMKLYMMYGEQNAVIAGDPDLVATHTTFNYNTETAFTNQTETRDIVRLRRDENNDLILDGNGIPLTETLENQLFKKSIPYYTYPQKWAAKDPKEPYLKLVLPWVRQALSAPDDQYCSHGCTWGSSTKQFYYHIVLPNIDTGFEKNTWYKIYLDVAILGSDTDEASVEIEGNYYVVDWNKNGSDVDVLKPINIQGSRYLSVAFNSYTMNNTTELKIPYVTSNKCEIAELSVSQWDFRNDRNVDKTTAAINGEWVKLDNNNNIVINHALDNVISSSTFDCSPYIFNFKIWHQDKNSYMELIEIIQYPAIYIKDTTSNGYAFVKEIENNTNSDYIFDNSSAANMYRRMGTMANRSAITGGLDDNTNQHQYTITVTVLPEGSPYSIGDPRIVGVDNLNSGITGLNNYRPADTLSNIIAPVFRIASSYGRTNQMTYEGAQKRCAAYQENGYPAGRWRLPTKAEIEYIMTLSNKELIPKLFDPEPTAGYWASGKIFMVRNSSGDLQFIKVGPTVVPTESSYTSGGRRIYQYDYNIGNVDYNVWARCVYDEWYWGSKRDGDHLTTWGGYQTN